MNITQFYGTWEESVPSDDKHFISISESECKLWKTDLDNKINAEDYVLTEIDSKFFITKNEIGFYIELKDESLIIYKNENKITMQHLV